MNFPVTKQKRPRSKSKTRDSRDGNSVRGRITTKSHNNPFAFTPTGADVGFDGNKTDQSKDLLKSKTNTDVPASSSSSGNQQNTEKSKESSNDKSKSNESSSGNSSAAKQKSTEKSKDSQKSKSKTVGSASSSSSGNQQNTEKSKESSNDKSKSNESSSDNSSAVNQKPTEKSKDSQKSKSKTVGSASSSSSGTQQQNTTEKSRDSPKTKPQAPFSCLQQLEKLLRDPSASSKYAHRETKTREDEKLKNVSKSLGSSAGSFNSGQPQEATERDNHSLKDKSNSSDESVDTLNKHLKAPTESTNSAAYCDEQHKKENAKQQQTTKKSTEPTKDTTNQSFGALGTLGEILNTPSESSQLSKMVRDKPQNETTTNTKQTQKENKNKPQEHGTSSSVNPSTQQQNRNTQVSQDGSATLTFQAKFNIVRDLISINGKDDGLLEVLEKLMREKVENDFNPFQFKILGSKPFLKEGEDAKLKSRNFKQRSKSVDLKVDKITSHYRANSEDYDRSLNDFFENHVDELDVDSDLVQQFKTQRQKYKNLKANCQVYDHIDIKQIPDFKYVTMNKNSTKDSDVEQHPDSARYDRLITLDRKKSVEDITKYHVFDFGKKGLGLRASKFLKANTYVTEYRGEIKSNNDIKIVRGEQNFSMVLSESKNLAIDAQKEGNFSRLLNHSCQNNVDCSMYNYKGETLVILTTNRDVQENEELSLHYGKPYMEQMGNCLCGEPNCTFKAEPKLATRKSERVSSKKSQNP